MGYVLHRFRLPAGVRVCENARRADTGGVFRSGYQYWRGASGKACVSTNGNVLAAGWENGWLLVMYETNNGSVRVGYVSGQDIKGAVPMNTYLTFEYTTAQVVSDCQLTDDPARCYASVTSLRAGDTVTYLTTYFNNSAWRMWKRCERHVRTGICARIVPGDPGRMSVFPNFFRETRAFLLHSRRKYATMPGSAFCQGRTMRGATALKNAEGHP